MINNKKIISRKFSKKSIKLNGVDQYINMGNASELSFEYTDTFSGSIWVNTPANGGSILSKRDFTTSVANDGWTFGIGDGGLRFIITANSALNLIRVDSIVKIPVNQWALISFTYDGTGLGDGVKLYINGESAGEVVVNDNLGGLSILTTEPFLIGAVGGDISGFFDGYINNCSIHNRVLNLSEINDLYNEGEPTDARKLNSFLDCVGYWPLGDGDTLTLSADRSGNFNNGISNALISTINPNKYVSKKVWTFNGTDQYINLGTGSELAFEASDPFTVSAWIRTNGANGYVTSRVLGSGFFPGWGVIVTPAGEIQWRHRPQSTNQGAEVVTVGAGIDDGNWHHIECKYDGNITPATTVLSVWIDGVEMQISSVNDEMTSSAGTVTASTVIAGRQGGLALYTGDISSVEISSREKTGQETAITYNNRFPTDASLTYDLVGAWRANDTVQNAVRDLSPSSNIGTLTNMTDTDVIYDPIRKIQSKGALFNGSTSGINCGIIPEHNFQYTDEFSVSFLINTSFKADLQAIISKVDSGALPPRGWQVYVLDTSRTEGAVRFNILAGTSSYLYANSDANISDGNYHRCVITYDGYGTFDGISMYIDGKSVAVINDGPYSSITGDMLSSEPTYIGRRDVGSYTNGILDDVIIYDHELTVDEVRLDYQSSLLRDDFRKRMTGLVSYWRMGDGPRDDISSNLLSDVIGVADGTTTDVVLAGNPDPGRPYVEPVSNGGDPITTTNLFHNLGPATLPTIGSTMTAWANFSGSGDDVTKVGTSDINVVDFGNGLSAINKPGDTYLQGTAVLRDISADQDMSVAIVGKVPSNGQCGIWGVPINSTGTIAALGLRCSASTNLNVAMYFSTVASFSVMPAGTPFVAVLQYSSGNSRFQLHAHGFAPEIQTSAGGATNQQVDGIPYIGGDLRPSVNPGTDDDLARVISWKDLKLTNTEADDQAEILKNAWGIVTV